MNLIPDREQFLAFLKKWWISIILVFFSWFILKQFWWALRYNIFFAVTYDHVPVFSILYFLMDNLTLIIHEAGHSIFGLFGWRFLTILGGTLLQLLIPFLVVVFAWTNRRVFLGQFSLYWLGFSWLDTAAYCADAYHRQLPLIGGLSKSAHDFHNLLNMSGLMDSYSTIAWLLYFTGAALLLAGVLWPLTAREQTEHVSIDLKL